MIGPVFVSYMYFNLFCDMEHLNILGRESAWCLVFLKILSKNLYECVCLSVCFDQQRNSSFKFWQPFSIHNIIASRIKVSRGLGKIHFFCFVGRVICKRALCVCVHLMSVCSMERADF